MRKVVEQVDSVDSSQCMCIYCYVHDVAHLLLHVVMCMCPCWLHVACKSMLPRRTTSRRLLRRYQGI